ncbi:SpoC1-C1C [Metarhizium acridum CQMa 102]|uniref:SpoC1-C1C n=1 Tax=Metarhizium acridum (strain CQMa 102) TaxID=655827 RepID=E9EFU6_METAQ|nr:SpoC1-C1C [Metarhizium acridum CQMa 102]EFY85233.1 SpoC1-C1C [Metarhizium acridum CQMa 102]
MPVLIANSGINPLHIADVLDASSKATIVHMSGKGRELNPPGSSKKFWKHENAILRSHGTSTESHSLIVKTGDELSHDFEAEANLSISYGGLSVSASSQYSYQSSFELTSVYGNYSFDQRVYSVQLAADPYEFVNPKLVKEALLLPEWHQDQATYEKYRLFFQKWGTYIILECFLGTRYQLSIESKETSSEKKQEIKACIGLEYKGLVSAGGSVADTQAYKAYVDARNTDCRVRGGDPGKAGILERDPTNMDKFNDWQESRKLDAMEALLSAKAESLAVFLAASSVQSHVEASQRLKPALDYFSSFRTLTGVINGFQDMYLKGGGYEVVPYPPTVPYSPGMEYKCTTSPLPGLVIKPESASGWTVTQLSPSSFTAKSYQKLQVPSVPITITAPMQPVDVTLWSHIEFVIPFITPRCGLGLLQTPSGLYRTTITVKSDGTTGTVHVPKLDLAGDFR